jgi:signal transduction histidine kinase
MNTGLNPVSIEEPAAETAEGERDRLVAFVAQELRRQLKPIREGALVLQRRNIDQEHARATARIIDRQSQMLERLIDELRDISEAQLGAIRLQRRRVSMSSIVESCLQTITPSLSDRGQSLEVRISRE